MNIMYAALMHESNTFSVLRTTLDVWKHGTWIDDPAVILDKDNYFLSEKMLQTASEYDARIIPGLVAMSVGPVITRECYEEAVACLLKSIEPHVSSLDGIVLGLHGAAAVEGMDDVETDILQRVRGMFSFRIPIAVHMDLHGNIGSRMVEHCDIIVSCAEYPHIDILWSIERAFELLVRTVSGEIEPVISIVKLPLLIPPACACTFEEPMKSLKTFVRQYEQEHGLLNCSFFHGFPFSDIPCSSSSIVVTADRDKASASGAARELASYVWSHRTDLKPFTLTAEEGIKRALSVGEGLTIVNETSDNPGGGAPCDGTHTLRVLLEKNPENSCFALICDPEAARIAHDAGEGAEIDVELGGKTDDIHGAPIPVHAKVVRVSDGVFIDNSPMSLGIDIHVGPSARLRIGNVDVNVVSRPYQVFGDGICRLHGVDAASLRLLCIKSSQHFKAYYRALAKEIVTVDPPGIHTSNLHRMEFRNLARPIYPLDADTEFDI